MRLFRLVIVLVCGFWTAPAFADMTDDTWHEVRSDNFQIYTNGDVKKVKALARDLELFRASVMLFIGSRNLTSDMPFHIIALRSQSDIRRFVPERPGRGLQTSGKFASTVRGNFALIEMSGQEYTVKGGMVSVAERVIKHEYVHYILRGNSRIRYPYWYEEGFAEYLSTLEYENGEVRLGFPIASWHFSLNDSGGRAQVEALLRATRNTDAVNMRALYGAGWLLVHHLHDVPELSAKIVPFLTEYDRTGDSFGAFNKVFQLDLDALTDQLAKKASRGKYGYRRLPLKAPLAEPRVAETRVALSDAQLVVADALRIFRRDETGIAEATAIYEDVLKSDPGNPSAVAALADIDMQQSRVTAAEARLATVPATVDAVPILIARGDVLMEKAFSAAEAPSELSPDLLEQARAHYIAALQKDNRSAEGFYSYGLTFLAGPGDPQEGVIALGEASRLVPSNDQIMLLHATMLLVAGEFDKAAELARTVEQLMESPNGRAFAETIKALAEDREAQAAKEMAFVFVKEMLAKKPQEAQKEEDG